MSDRHPCDDCGQERCPPSCHAATKAAEKEAEAAVLAAGRGEKQMYDELLYERVKQLREIDERLEKIGKGLALSSSLIAVDADRAIRQLRNDLADMIREAERQHAEF